MSNSIEILPIEQVRLNDDNPRLIKDDRFAQLKASIEQFPEMLQLRPLIIDEAGVVLGGNMRLSALLQLKYAEVPVIRALGLTDEQKREFIIKDNASFGEWNWELLANGEWGDAATLNAWGLNVPKDWDGEPEPEEEGTGMIATESSIKITFLSVEQAQKAQAELQKLLEKKYEGATLTLSIK
jgi:hypothetical protein